ncbi:hypothetical protein DsansV1_C19g0158331 [Dioscorea sansibarensis]
MHIGGFTKKNVLNRVKKSIYFHGSMFLFPLLAGWIYPTIVARWMFFPYFHSSLDN